MNEWRIEWREACQSAGTGDAQLRVIAYPPAGEGEARVIAGTGAGWPAAAHECGLAYAFGAACPDHVVDLWQRGTAWDNDGTNGNVIASHVVVA